MGRRRSIEKAKENADSTTMMMMRWWLGSRRTSKRSRRMCAVHSINQIQRPRQTRKTAPCLRQCHLRQRLPNQPNQRRSLLLTQHMTTPPTPASKTLLLCHNGHDQLEVRRRKRQIVQETNHHRLLNLTSRLRFGLYHSDMPPQQKMSRGHRRVHRLHQLMMMRLRTMSFDDTMDNEL